MAEDVSWALNARFDGKRGYNRFSPFRSGQLAH